MEDKFRGGIFWGEFTISNWISDFWLSEALTKKRNVPTLDGDDLDTDSDLKGFCAGDTP